MTAETSDPELITAYIEGSETAFRALVARHINLVYATALRQVGDPGLAEEISQNVFVVLARKAPQLRGAQTLAGWLHRTTILEAKARIRAELRRRRRDQTAAELATIQNEGAPALDALVPLLDEGLLKLRESERLALVLRFLEDRSLREVGVAMGVDEDAARKRVSRALERLTDFFKSRGFVIAGGAAVVLTASAKAAAPASLTFLVGNAGLTAGIVTGGFKGLLLQGLSLSKTQTAILCALVAAAPLTFQWHARAQVNRERADLEAQLAEARKSASDLEQEARNRRGSALRIQNEAFNLRTRLATVNAQLAGRAPHPIYHWDDNSPVMRIPKQGLSFMPIATVSRLGELTDGIKEILQLTALENAQVQAALNQFVADYYAAQAKQMRVVDPDEDELNGRAREEVRVFEFTALGPKYGELRQQLFSTLESVLGADRFQILRKRLSDWMAVDDRNLGMSSSMEIVNMDRREAFYRPDPGTGIVRWRFSSKRGMVTMNDFFRDTDIPTTLRPYLQDWITLAQTKPATAEKGNP